MIKLIDFTALSPAEFWLVFAWRNDPKIAPFMTTGGFDISTHNAFIKSLKSTKNRRYFLVYSNNFADFAPLTPIGVIDFVVSEGGKIATFGLYQNPHLRGCGDILMRAIIDYAKKNLRAARLNASVLASNQPATRLYRRFGFIFDGQNDAGELLISLDLAAHSTHQEREQL